MRTIALLSALSSLLALSSLAAAQDNHAALALAFPEAKVSQETAVLTAAQRALVTEQFRGGRVPRLFSHWVACRDGQVQGYAVIDDVLGKCAPITYLLAVDARLVIQRVEILAYRESHGGEVRGQAWRAQFAGKDPANPPRLGHGITNIAGATISCTAVTAAVRRNLACLAALYPPATADDRQPTAIADDTIGSNRAIAITSTDALDGPFARTQMLMGTTLEITLFAEDQQQATAAQDAAFACIAGIERILSHYQAASPLTAMRRDAGQPAKPKDPVLLDFLATAQHWCDTTSGALDITVGPLVELWRTAEQTQSLPTAAQLAAARACCGPGILTLDAAAGVAALTRAGAALDPGALGKGFALDRAAAVLRRRGIAHALLNFGGQILAVGPRSDQTAWTIGWSDAGSARATTLQLMAGSVSTTADDQRGMCIAGKRYSHVIDPRNGRPAEGMRKVVVYAATATEADAWSTALFVQGFDSGSACAADHGVAACLVDAQGHSQMTNEFKALVASSQLEPASEALTHRQ